MRRSVLLTCTITLLSPVVATAGTLTTLANLPAHIDGASPAAALVELNGKYYGTTYAGGTGQGGTIFGFDPSTGKETLLYSFAGNSGAGPTAPLTVVAGKLYGTTSTGGAANGGTVFSFDPATGTETLLYGFADEFTQPSGALTELGGLLYGTAAYGGANGSGYIYTVDPTTGAETTVYSFKDGNDGAAPQGGLCVYNGELYGATASGGSMLFGTIFRLNPNTGAVTTLHAFDRTDSISGTTAGLTVLGDVLYSTAEFGGSRFYGSVYAFDLGTNQFSVAYTFSPNGTDGYFPSAGLLAVNGLLYGTTSGGGSADDGTVFSLDPTTGTEMILHSFNGQDGSGPEAALIEAGGRLLGTTQSGGLEGEGNVFSIDPSSGNEMSLYDFVGSPRSTNSALIAFRGALYGTSTQAGAFNAGSIFRIDPRTGVATTVYSFNALDGFAPSTALVNLGGVLYGATSRGGSHSAGTLFSFDPSTKKQTTIFNFDNATSAWWPNGLTSQSGILYGSTEFGASSGPQDGTLFSFDPASGTFVTLYTFSQTDGQNAQPGIIAVNGTLLGTTFGSGGQSRATVFSFVLSSATFSTVYNFGSPGEYLSAGLVYANGVLFGSTVGFKKSPATIFQIDPTTGTETVLHTLVKPEQLSTMISVGNVLYGVVGNGGSSQYGSIFSFDPATQRFKKLYDFTGGTDGGDPDAALLAVNNHLFGTTASITTGSAGTVFRFDR